MTVQELIDVLSALSDEDKAKEVTCSYDTDHAFTRVAGIAVIDNLSVRLQGD